MSRLAPTVVRVAEIASTPWRNGGGVTRELLAWPSPEDWLLRVSVADVKLSGPFSAYTGIDRWIAVLEGGAVRLDTAGAVARELTALQPDLHPFPGDVATHCTLLGAETRDFNLMADRARIRVKQQSLQKCPVLKTRAAIAGLFVTQEAELRQEPNLVRPLHAFTLVWWSNADGSRLSLQLGSEGVRGWWFEADPIASKL